MVYSPDQVKLKYVVLFNMEGDRKWESGDSVDIEEVESPSPPAEGKSAKCSRLGALPSGGLASQCHCYTGCSEKPETRGVELKYTAGPKCQTQTKPRASIHIY